MGAADAAQVWLARLAPAQRLAAHAFTDARLTAWLCGFATLVLVSALVSRSGLLGRVQAILEAQRPRPWLASALCAAVLVLILALANAPVEAFTAWRRDLTVGDSTGGLLAHLARPASDILQAVGAAALLAPLLYALMRKAPRRWALITGGVFVVLALAVGWAPYALMQGPPMTPAPAGAVRDAVAQLVAQTGVPAHGIYATSEPGYDADVMGGFGRATVVLGPQLMAGPPAEAKAYVGHLMSHYWYNDLLVAWLIDGAIAVLACLAVQRFAAPLARWIGAPAGVRAADPQAMPAAVIIAAVAVLAATLAGNGYLRWANVRADQYSLDHAREPDALATVIERFWDGRTSVDPSPLETALFYPHPPLRQRLVHIAAWKAAHPGR